MTERADLAELIKQDHAEIERRFAQYESGMTAATYDEIVTAAVQGLNAHAAAEERVVYPVIREALGEEEADRSIAEHRRIDALLRRLDGAAHDADTTSTFTELMAEVRHHVPPEEAELLPRLQREVGDERMAELGAAFTAAKAEAPASPGRDRLGGALASVLDRVSGVFSHKGRKP